MSEIPAEIDAIALECWGTLPPEAPGIAHIAHALLAVRDAEREKQRDRVVKMLIGIADILSKRMTDTATPELLKALAEAVKSSDASPTELNVRGEQKP